MADDTDADRTPVWTRRDRIALVALELYEASLCEGCQQNRQRAMNPAMAGSYQVHPHECYGCAALEQIRKGQTETYGVKNYVVDAGPADLPPHPFRLEPIDPELYDEYMSGGTGGPSEPAEAVGL